MQLATFDNGGRPAHVGVVLGEEIADLSACEGGPASLQQLLQRPDWAGHLPGLVKNAPRLTLESVTLRAPVPKPPKYMAIGLNAHRPTEMISWWARCWADKCSGSTPE
jgi:hypothetical protein